MTISEAPITQPGSTGGRWSPAQTPVSRRSALKWTAAIGGSAALVGTGVAATRAAADPKSGEVTTVWSSCNINCGSRCPLRLQVKDGVVVRVLPDDTGGNDLGDQQLRACVRGRSMRQRIYSPDRLKKPLMRKPGTKRGDEQWVEISWEEAIKLVGDKLKGTIEKYSNEAILFHYGSGGTGGNITKRGAWQRFLATIGGYLHAYGTYSTAQIQTATPYHYGGAVNSNSFADAKFSRLQVMFGTNPVETRMSGGGEMYVVQRTRTESKVRTIVIDPRYSETALTVADEWVPIRPGSDAALVAALVNVMVKENLQDQAFLDANCIGFDEAHMPAGVPTGNSYRSYVMGLGPDGIEKTPAWAETLTGIPAARIVRLAREIATTKPCAITQGWGVQRQANGENGSRAIMTLSNVTGNVGIKGGGTGCAQGNYSLPVAAFDSDTYYKNSVETRIPVFAWPDAITKADKFDEISDGLRYPAVKNAAGVGHLKDGLKFLVAFSSNTITNQHSDVNATMEMLKDDSKCEFILSIDHMYVHSVKFADLILPDVMTCDQGDLVPGGYAGEMGYVIYTEKAVEPLFDTRPSYQICADIAGYLEKTYGDFTKDGQQPFKDAKQRFTLGLTQEQWRSKLYQDTKKAVPNLPSETDLRKQGVYRQANPAGTTVAMAKWRQDPVANEMATIQKGMVEDPHRIAIFSKVLWDISQTWKLPPGDRITALPEQYATWEGPEEAVKNTTYPLQMISHHTKGRTHSTYANLPWIQEAHPQKCWLNPIDAQARGVANDDEILVWNDRGMIRLPAFVTPRIIPGVISVPQGAWYNPSPTQKDSKGRPVDTGGNPNTLTKYHPSSLAKGNPQHTNLVQVKKA